MEIEIAVNENFKTSYCSTYRINIKEYKEWLGDQENNEENLLEYISMFGEITDSFENTSNFIDWEMKDTNDIERINNSYEQETV